MMLEKETLCVSVDHVTEVHYRYRTMVVRVPSTTVAKLPYESN